MGARYLFRRQDNAALTRHTHTPDNVLAHMHLSINCKERPILEVGAHPSASHFGTGRTHHINNSNQAWVDNAELVATVCHSIPIMLTLPPSIAQLINPERNEAAC